MEMNDLLPRNCVVASLNVTSKKQLLQELAKLAAPIVNQNEHKVFDTLIERERLGTTGVGSGIAIPHGKLDGLDAIQGMFIRLEKPIDFDAIDDEPVDLIFLLLAPENAGAEHLKALARVSRLLRDHNMCEKLRGANEADGLYALLTDPAVSYAA